MRKLSACASFSKTPERPSLPNTKAYQLGLEVFFGGGEGGSTRESADEEEELMEEELSEES